MMKLTEKIGRFFARTRAEAMIMAMAGAIAGGAFSYQYELDRLHTRPTVFSEVGNIYKEALQAAKFGENPRVQRRVVGNEILLTLTADDGRELTAVLPESALEMEGVEAPTPDDKIVSREFLHQTVGPLTRTLSTSWDLTIKLIEDANEAFGSYAVPRDGFQSQEIGRTPADRFAQLLQWRLDNDQYHHDLTDFFTYIPRWATASLSDLDNWREALQLAAPVSDAFHNAVDYDYSHNYHTETRTWTDSEGDTHSEDVEVYDDTDHYFYFHQPEALEALKQLVILHREWKDITIEEVFRTSSKVQQENIDAIIRTFKRQKDRLPTNKEMVSLAALFYTGSTLTNTAPRVYSSWGGLREAHHEWQHMIGQAMANTDNRIFGRGRVKHIKVSSKTHPGPAWYQSAKNIHYTSDQLQSDVHTVRGGLYDLVKQVPHLQQQVSEIIHQASTRETQFKRLDKSNVALYKKNFREGLDIDGFRWPYVIGFSLLGAILVGGIGLALDHRLDAHWEKKGYVRRFHWDRR